MGDNSIQIGDNQDTHANSLFSRMNERQRLQVYNALLGNNEFKFNHKREDSSLGLGFKILFLQSRDKPLTDILNTLVRNARRFRVEGIDGGRIALPVELNYNELRSAAIYEMEKVLGGDNSNMSRGGRRKTRRVKHTRRRKVLRRKSHRRS